MRRLVVAAVAVLIVGAGPFGWWWHQNRAFVGTTVPATVTWNCWNHISWTDPGTGNQWLLEDGQSQTAILAPDPSIPSATGTVSFDTTDRATFTSATGAIVTLKRANPNEWWSGGCVVPAIRRPMPPPLVWTLSHDDFRER